MKKILYINMPWMERYDGAIKGVDEPKGYFGYTLKNPMNDHCQFNFRRSGGRLYGHVPGSTNPDLTKLGASRSDNSINGVTAVWIATDPNSGGRVVVGWYKDATVWKKRQDPKGNLARQRTIRASGDICKFSVEAASGKRLLPGMRPLLNIAKGRPGQNPYWYGNRSANAQVSRLVASGSASARQQPPTKDVRGGWVQNVAERLKIEANAMDKVEEYFGGNGYDVQRRSHENLGYDMLAVSKAVGLQLEVKGNKGRAVCVELTPNEFKCAKKNLRTFRLCVVVDALNKIRSKRRLHVYRPVRNAAKWEDESGSFILTVEKTGAVIRE